MKQVKKWICVAVVIVLLLSLAGCTAAKPVTIEPMPFTEDEGAIVQLFTDVGLADVVRFKVSQGSNITGGNFSLEKYEYGQSTGELIDLFPAQATAEEREFNVLCAVYGSNNPKVRLTFHNGEMISSSGTSISTYNTISSFSYSQQNKPIEVKPGEERILAAFSLSSANENGESDTYVYDVEELEKDISLLHTQEYAVVLKCKFYDGTEE